MPKPKKTKKTSQPKPQTFTPAAASFGSAATEASMLLVDVHAHVFNGKDIPLKEFLHYGRGVPWGLAYMVEWLITHPLQATAQNKEQAKLVAVSEGAKQSDFQEAEDRGLIERFFAYADLMGRSDREIADVMLRTYPSVDLFTPAITDMDCWLGDATFYDNRVKAHADLAAAKDKDHRGKIHPIIGFDPVRQVATRRAFGSGKDHLAQVQRAVEHQGFVGVKVYPPMGYRPTRNDWLYPGGQQVVRPDEGPVRCRLSPDQPSQAVSMTGDDLNRAMLELFDYCIQDDVPVMVHCTSHGAESAKYRGYNADPRHWRELLTMSGGKYSDLRLNLAHFGGDSQRPSFVQGTLELVARFPNVYGDVGAHSLVWQSGKDRGFSYAYELMSALEEGQDWTRKLMLGSDWHTIYVDPSPGIYLRNYLNFFNELSLSIDQRSAEIGKPLCPDDHATRQANFAGLTALRFLGLDAAHPNSKPRKRLERFYLTNNIFTLQNGDQPPWW